MSFSTGKSPVVTEILKVIPIHTHTKKKQSKVDYKNYRPISLLSNIEKLMYKRLSHILDDSCTWFVGLLVILR